jgi:hypothetical protein
MQEEQGGCLAIPVRLVEGGTRETVPIARNQKEREL